MLGFFLSCLESSFISLTPSSQKKPYKAATLPTFFVVRGHLQLKLMSPILPPKRRVTASGLLYQYNKVRSCLSFSFIVTQEAFARLGFTPCFQLMVRFLSQVASHAKYCLQISRSEGIFPSNRRILLKIYHYLVLTKPPYPHLSFLHFCCNLEKKSSFLLSSQSYSYLMNQGIQLPFPLIASIHMLPKISLS